MLISVRLVATLAAVSVWAASLTLAASARGATPRAANATAGVAVQQPSPETPQPSAETIEKGREVAERVCTACHELGPDVTAGRGADAWKKVVEEMRVMGAQLSDEEVEIVLAYLIHTYPAKSGR
jgi:cytochrome c5